MSRPAAGGPESPQMLHSEGQRARLVIGVCTMDVKARSKPMRNILNRLLVSGDFDVVIFGDKVILDEDVETWPYCDFLISFFSRGFPLHKALAYVRLRQPFCVNDLSMQQIPFDRRMVLRVLEAINVPTPRRVVRNSNDPPVVTPDVKTRLRDELGIEVRNEDFAAVPWEQLDADRLRVGDQVIEKPFVEKPVDGENHNVYIYYHSADGGGVRKLFRKIANKSSEFDPSLSQVRATGSFIYEEFMRVDNAEDVKVYTIGDRYVHAETRKSPVIDGLVVRNTEGKEVRYVAELKEYEKQYAYRISRAFGQYVCGFDMLRASGKTFIIDVNGWSFVKGNQEYYAQCAEILRDVFLQVVRARQAAVLPALPLGAANCSSSAGEDDSTVVSPSDSAPPSAWRPASPPLPHRSPRGLGPGVSLGTGLAASLGHVAVTSQTSPPDASVNAPRSISGAGDEASAEDPNYGSQWKLKAYICVLRHGDRTPKQKMKFHVRSAPFTSLLTQPEEIVLKKRHQIQRVRDAVREALANYRDQDDVRTLQALGLILDRKGDLTETKIQIKPCFAKSAASGEKVLERVQVIVKWGGEFTHAGRFQSRDLGENMRKELLLINRGLLDDVRVYSSSERRVIATTEVFTEALLTLGDGEPGPPSATLAPRVSSASTSSGSLTGDEDEISKDPVLREHITISKEMLDDSNAAKEQMELVKAKLRDLLNPNVPNPVLPPEVRIPEEVEASGGPEALVDSISDILTRFRAALAAALATAPTPGTLGDQPLSPIARFVTNAPPAPGEPAPWCCHEDPSFFSERWERHFRDFCDRGRATFDIGKISELYDSLKFDVLHNRDFLRAVFDTAPDLGGDTLRVLYNKAKTLFDLIAPQEYGITREEKFGISLLNSRPLLRQLVSDLKGARGSHQPPYSRWYFTKESKVICLLNIVLLCGIPNVAAQLELDELDYLTKITFELYERRLPSAAAGSSAYDGCEYSLRIGFSPGAHDANLVDSQVDERHSLTVQPRRWVTDFVALDDALAHLERTERGIDPFGVQHCLF